MFEIAFSFKDETSRPVKKVYGSPTAQLMYQTVTRNTPSSTRQCTPQLPDTLRLYMSL